MTIRNENRNTHWTKIVRTSYFIGSLVLLVIVFPKLLPGWILQLTSNCLEITQFIFSPMEQNGFAIIAAIGYIRKAHSNVETEYERLTLEHDAFHDFAKEIQTLSVSAPQGSPNTVLAVETSSTGNRLQIIQDVYRETVMAVPHFDEDYGESLRENMAAEFNQDVATAVVDGQRFSPQLKQLLVKQAHVAARQRKDLIETVAQECNSLTDAYTQLRETTDTLERTIPSTLDQQSFSELVSSDKKLRADIAHCEQLLTDRQRKLHQHKGGTDQLLHQYLYDQLDDTFPVLNATLDRIRRLKKRRREVIRALIRRY